MSTLSDLLSPYVERVEAEMQDFVPALERHDFMHLLHYHLGWSTLDGQPTSRPSGKRVRSALALMVAEGLGCVLEAVMPAAVAVELLHEFTLIHDDIQDGDRTRRHQPSLWSLVGVPQAINAGDGLFAMAQNALLASTARGVPAERTLHALRRFNETAVALCIGQYLDMSFEQRAEVTTTAYLEMVGGKTAALLAFACEVGALVAGADDATVADAQRFGEALGLAFQIHDDVLGIWGDPAATGKPVGADIRARKKSLPVAYALGQPQSEALRSLYQGALDSDEAVAQAIALIEAAGGRAITEQMAAEQEARARSALGDLPLTDDGRARLTQLLDLLAGREA